MANKRCGLLDYERIGMLFLDRAKTFGNLLRMHLENLQSQIQWLRRRLRFGDECCSGGWSRSTSRPTRASCGTTSLSSSSRFPANSVEKSVTPVMFPPGRAKLATSLLPIGSEIAVMTTGIVLLRSRMARIASVLFEAITSTFN